MVNVDQIEMSVSKYINKTTCDEYRYKSVFELF